MAQDHAGPGGLGGVLVVLDRAGGAARAGLHAARVAADLTWGEGRAPVPQGVGELGGIPGPILAEQVADLAGDLLTTGGIGGRPGPAGEEGVAAPGSEVVEEVQGRAIVAVEVVGNACGGPSGVGQEDHLQAVTDLGQEVLMPEGLEIGASSGVELDADHTAIVGKPWPNA